MSINQLKKILSLSIIFFILFISFITLIGCVTLPNPNNPLYGNIQINSNPTGASIYLNGAYTGFQTPYTLEDVANGSLITLKLSGYLNSNNIVQIFPNQSNMLNIELTPNNYPPVSSYLTSINISPSTIDLNINQAFNITSINAFYSDGTNISIPYSKCTFLSINKNIATVSSTGKITGIAEGETTVWTIYTENNITKSDSIFVNVSGSNDISANLTAISVSPSNMDLSPGESKSISSIIAYYENGVEKTINPEQCSISADNSVVSVNDTGIITANTIGNSVVTVTYTENDITRSDTIAVSVSEATVSDTTYRALAIGVGDYIYYGEDGDLIAPPYDVIKVKELFYDCKFGNKNTSFTKISELKDTQATKTNIIQKIQSTFSGADTDDVSYFYFSGHGYTLNQTSYLCPTDFNGETDKAISVDELESALSSIPGKKVVLIDSCNSGGFIGKSISNNGSDEIINYLADFNESIINTFSNKPLSKDLLTSSEYQVLTSSHWYQESYEIQPIEGDPFGVFTQGLYEGCSLDNNIPADANQDDKISLQEAYEFISQWTASMRYNQNVQVYPLNSNFTIFEY